MNALSYRTTMNYAALAVAVLAPCTVETAFEKLQSDHPDEVRVQLDERDLDDIMVLKRRGVTWPELAEIYGTTWTTIYGRVRKRPEKKPTLQQVEAKPVMLVPVYQVKWYQDKPISQERMAMT